MCTHHNTQEFAASCLSHHLKPWPCVRSGTLNLSNKNSTSVFHESDKKRRKVSDMGCQYEHIKPSYMGWVRLHWAQIFTLLLTTLPSRFRAAARDRGAAFPPNNSLWQAGCDVEHIRAPSSQWDMGQLLPRAALLPLSKMQLPTRCSEVSLVSLPSCLICLGSNWF